MQNQKTEANLVENGRGRSAPVQSAGEQLELQFIY